MFDYKYDDGVGTIKYKNRLAFLPRSYMTFYLPESHGFENS